MNRYMGHPSISAPLMDNDVQLKSLCADIHCWLVIQSMLLQGRSTFFPAGNRLTDFSPPPRRRHRAIKPESSRTILAIISFLIVVT